MKQRPVKSSVPTAAAFCKSAEEVVKELQEVGKQVKKPVLPNSDGNRRVDYEAVVTRTTCSIQEDKAAQNKGRFLSHPRPPYKYTSFAKVKKCGSVRVGD